MFNLGPYTSYADVSSFLWKLLGGLAPFLVIGLFVLICIFWYRVYMIVRYEYYKRK